METTGRLRTSPRVSAKRQPGASRGTWHIPPAVRGSLDGIPVEGEGVAVVGSVHGRSLILGAPGIA
eukprot:7579000-Heterocapsa_arctica.AAC.1